MRFIEAGKTGVLNLGYAGEKDRTTVLFPIGDLQAEFPGGTVVLKIRRPWETDHHDIVPEIEGDTAKWLVGDYDLETRGEGECVLVYSDGSAIAKRKVWETRICRSNEGEDVSIPPDWEDIKEEMILAAGELAAAGAALQEKIDSYNDMTAEARQLPEGSDPTAEIDHTGAAPKLKLGIPKGDTGETGAPGADGADGFSPIIAVENITGGHRVTITDKNGTKTVDLMDGQDGQDGQTGPTGNGIVSITKTGTSGRIDTYTVLYTNGNTDTFQVTNGDAQIDDTAGAGDTTKVWSADKLTDKFSTQSEDIENLKNAISSIGTQIKSKNLYNSSETTVGYLDSSTGAINSATTSRKTSDYVSVTPGKYLTISRMNLSTQEAYTAPSICFFNSSKSAISGGNTWKTNLVVPSGAAFARVCLENNDTKYQIEITNDGTFTTYEDYFDSYYIINQDINIPISQITGLEDHLEDLDENAEEIDNIETALSDISESVTYDRFDVYTGPYYSNGVEPDGSTAVVGSWQHTDRIPVVPGEVLIGTTTDHTTTMGFKRLCAYHDDTIVPASGIGSEQNSYTVPEGINYVVITQGTTDSSKVVSIEITGINDLSKQVIPKAKIGYMRDSGDMQDGTILKVKENNVKNNVIVSFSGNITTFDKLIIGQRKADNSAMGSCYIEVDSTNVVVNSDQGTTTIPHGLTIANDIQVMVCTGNEVKTTLIRVVSSGSVFNDTTEHRWLCDEGFACAVSDGSTLTDCALSWTSRNISKDIWIFGDSYVSLYDVRWVHWMIQDGFDKNCIINGFAGENSKIAMRALENLLSISCPRYIVWCLGMNDSDSVSAVNSSWDENCRKMISLCKRNGVTPILATIPNVPTGNNSFKNAIVRESGYRYIEFSKAVDPDEDGTWISGALSGDEVHPTEIGAHILYQRVLVDFPEIVSL